MAGWLAGWLAGPTYVWLWRDKADVSEPNDPRQPLSSSSPRATTSAAAVAAAITTTIYLQTPTVPQSTSTLENISCKGGKKSMPPPSLAQLSGPASHCSQPYTTPDKGRYLPWRDDADSSARNRQRERVSRPISSPAPV
ncbi:hypothetical protein O3P69_005943 [Scylla paramamosain]|uniref:Uncharacterized protein n=1 Tax=Scylla paramamosain TaxID=85552 RepID=A0AAW0U425_SCYPA